MEFAPGQDALVCPFCGAENRIHAEGTVEEQDLLGYFERLEDAAPHTNVTSVTCGACGATPTVPPNATSFSCPFCGSNIVAKANECSVIKPHAVLPFKMTREQATQAFRAWLKKLWWAPGKLKKQSLLDAALTGIYLPHFTYDADATTDYTGERGEAYYETQWVTVNGRRQARQVRKVRWYPASGRVFNRFDDILVPATTSLEPERVRDLTPWDLAECVPYRDEYVAGFRAERYTVGLKEGFAEAQQRMAPVIDSTIRADIGGDEQRIHRRHTVYGALTFKHLLLPIWVSAYRYNGKVYSFLVNARTGEVQGHRPYSAWKISLAVVAAIVFILVLAYTFSRA
ncbi:MAG TPA: hypothetical protein VD971_04965 [Phycisphaerales bacterium]|nr:hypothetical protein [Phycisphaerales bacterium]